MEAFLNSITTSLLIEGFDTLILLIVLFCLHYQTVVNKGKMWQLFLDYVICLFLSQAFDIIYKIYKPNPYVIAAERILSTAFGFLSFIFTALFVFEFIEKYRPINRAFRSLILVLLSFTMMCSIFLKCQQAINFEISQTNLSLINSLYSISFIFVMIAEMVVIILYRKALTIFDSIVFFVIPLMHIIISKLPGLSFNFQYIVRNVLSTMLSILVLGISMVHQTRDLVAQKEHSQKVTGILDKYVGFSVARELLSNDQNKHNKNITIMFADIQGYSKLCETLSPEATLKVLNKCLSVIDECVTKYNGVLDKYIGDCGMAFWNGINDQEDAELLACQCAMDIRKGIKTLFIGDDNDELSNITVNIGINAGNAIVGNIGSEHRSGFSVIGDNVNIAERIQSEAHGGKIYISESIKNRVKGIYKIDFVGEIRLQGKTIGTKVYELEQR